MADYKIYIGSNQLLDFDDPSMILNDVKITKKINDISYLDFDIYSDHYFYSSIKSGDIIDVYEDEKWIFRGRIGLIQVSTNLKKHIQAYDPIGWLDDVCLNRRFDYTNGTYAPTVTTNVIMSSYDEYMQDSSRALNFTGGFSREFVTNTATEAFNASDTSFSTCLAALNNIFVNDGYLNIYVEYDEDDEYPIMRWSDVEPSAGDGLIEFGNNIIDFSRIENIKQSYNCLTPYTSTGLTISSIANGTVAPGIQKSGIRMWDNGKSAEYGEQCTSVQFEAANAQNLLICGIDWLQRQEKLSAITVKAIDLSVIDNDYQSIDIWQRIRCVSEPHGIDEVLVCTDLVKNITSPSDSTYTIGHREKSLTQKIKELK